MYRVNSAGNELSSILKQNFMFGQTVGRFASLSMFAIIILTVIVTMILHSTAKCPTGEDEEECKKRVANRSRRVYIVSMLLVVCALLLWVYGKGESNKEYFDKFFNL